MKRTVSLFEVVAVSIFICMLIGLGIWWEYNIWTECRAFGHSWFYCFNLLGNK